ncbi:MAG: carboxylesterase [Pirellulaceae bacterium]|nr:MAG: carboxylesterase [Pirellulaceae bacterium]
MQQAAWILLLIVLVWTGSDLAYSLWVRWRWRRWEQHLQFDNRGVRPGCDSFRLGTGREPAAILCIHGFNDSPRVFQLLARRWNEAGFFVHALRLPGFAEHSSQSRHVGAADWLHAVFEAMITLRRDHQHVYVAGHSLGGALAIAVLRQHAALADACILIAPALDVSRARSPVFHPQVWHKLANYLLLFTEAVYSFFPLDVMQPALPELPCTTRFSWRRMHDEMFRLFAENRQQAGQFAVPCFLALAGHDHIVDNQAAMRFLEEARCPVKQKKVYDRSAHVLPIDGQWEELANDVLEFLDHCRSVSDGG